jgi:hypothetical protein
MGTEELEETPIPEAQTEPSGETAATGEIDPEDSERDEEVDSDGSADDH